MRIRTGGGWVRDVSVDEMGGWVVGGGRDEEVRVWDRGVRFFPFIFPLFPLCAKAPPSPRYSFFSGELIKGAISRPENSTTPTRATTTRSRASWCRTRWPSP